MDLYEFWTFGGVNDVGIQASFKKKFALLEEPYHLTSPQTQMLLTVHEKTTEIASIDAK